MHFQNMVAFSFAEETAALDLARKLGCRPADEFRRIIDKYPNFHEFIIEVRDHHGNDAVMRIWRRLWFAIVSERSANRNDTEEALARLPSPRDRIMRFPPQFCAKPANFYLIELDRLVNSA